MSIPPTVQQPKPTNPTLGLLPDEYIRFDHVHKPGCCCFTSKITTVTNQRLITRTIKPPPIFSKRTSCKSGPVKIRSLTDIHNVKELRSAIPSSENTWWMKCIDILTCGCWSPQINWLESCGVDNLAMETPTSTRKSEALRTSILVEKF